MAVELCSESCGAGMSPRISFSQDFSQTDAIPVEQRPLRSNSSGLNSSIDFDFCVQESFAQESSSADELFLDGKILPIEIKKKGGGSSDSDIPLPKQKGQSHPPLPPPRAKSSHKNSTKDPNFNAVDDEAEEKQSSKSFWRFKRSSSCGNGYGRSLCPLPLLSRSNSTGSTPNVKQNNSQRQGSTKLSSNSQSSGSNGYQKPPLKKGHGPYGNNVRINPVLNVPSANLFGLGSIFSNGNNNNRKNKSKKKNYNSK